MYLFVYCIITYAVRISCGFYFCFSKRLKFRRNSRLKVIFSSRSKRRKTNDIHVSNIKLYIIRILIISHSTFDCVIMVIDMLTLKIILICIILIELLLKRWLRAFFNNQRLKLNSILMFSHYFFVLVHISIKIYLF